MPRTDPDPQLDVLAFLADPANWPAPGPVTHVQTHGAHVFLCGEEARKIKRAVRYDYMDLSTPDLRHAMLVRELELNSATAPMIYRDVVAITHEKANGLAVDGPGAPVEWMLRMHRFAAGAEMTEVADSGRLTDAVAIRLGRVIRSFHAGCPVRDAPGDMLIEEILDELDRVLAPFTAGRGDDVARFLQLGRQALVLHAPLLRDRTAAGHVRRAHGDLHLRNLLLLDGQPVLFDALEFDERLGTCDVLYDLAFLVMDLCHRDMARQANLVLNAWIEHANDGADAGLAALPLFMAVRAAIRAMVALQTDQASGQTGASADEAALYLQQATNALRTPAPTLIAVGGLSGTGKTVLARDLAPGIGPCPGAIHLRSDTLRKAMDTPVTYSAAARGAVYDRMFARAVGLLAAGQSVVLDATFLDTAHRQAAETLAQTAGVPFHGIWLTAPLPVLLARVSVREGDASDADAAVVRAQLAMAPAPASGWHCVDAGDAPAVTLAAARRVTG